MDRPSPEDYQTPLTRWGRIWRVLGMLVIVAIAWPPIADDQWHDQRPLFWLDVALGVTAFVLVRYRRRWPLAIALVIAALSAFSAIAAGPAVLAAVSLATGRRYWQLALVGAVNMVAGQTLVEIQAGNGEPAWLTLLVNAVFTIAVLGWGMYIGSRRELIWTLRHRAERAEEEQEFRVSQARSNERARIAREMHDVLAHRISQISMHAGALGFREDLSADEMRASASVIQEKAHEALTDLRGVLGVLRDDQTGELVTAPQPTYADLPLLVGEAGSSGLRVDYHDLLEPSGQPVPDVVGRTIYRIVQEGITNARKHAPGSLLTIEVSGSPDDGVDIVLRNPVGFGISETPGAGLGLVGLSERAELRGGRLEHGRDGSVFVLHGWIPWAA
ncbi:histidine kinase [Nocardioides sp.]|uniref:sensor histidine kinase n=1 Tax=Nocardioides sp. TaxID=35761 RepID=UPI0031FF32F2|nr:histidine kinase, dimerization and phosphoacceptor region [Nocardioides sp.]